METLYPGNVGYCWCKRKIQFFTQVNNNRLAQRLMVERNSLSATENHLFVTLEFAFVFGIFLRFELRLLLISP